MSPNKKFLGIVKDIAQAVADWGPQIACERSDTNWDLDPRDEADRTAAIFFTKTGLDPNNPTHRDLVLDWILGSFQFGGKPVTPDVDKLAILEAVASAQQALRKQNLRCSVKDACQFIAGQHRRSGHAKRALNGSRKTLERRYYRALGEMRSRIETPRFQRDYTGPQLEQLRKILFQK